MEHREATEHLLDFVAGGLGRASRDAVTRHVASCSDCRDWVETHDVLASALEVPPERGHPDSEVLALCAVRSEEEYEPDRFGLRIHLEGCARCRREVDLVRSAVLDARPTEIPTTVSGESRKVSPQWTYAVAASLAAAAIGTLLVVGLWQGRNPGDRPSKVVSTSAEAPVRDGVEPTQEEFLEAEIGGIRLIETQGGLIISRTKIKDGAQVTIHAGKSVAFGNGFQIGQRARIAVGGNPGDPSAKSRGAQNG
jgi:hypothetical protein